MNGMSNVLTFNDLGNQIKNRIIKFNTFTNDSNKKVSNKYRRNVVETNHKSKKVVHFYK